MGIYTGTNIVMNGPLHTSYEDGTHIDILNTNFRVKMFRLEGKGGERGD